MLFIKLITSQPTSYVDRTRNANEGNGRVRFRFRFSYLSSSFRCFHSKFCFCVKTWLQFRFWLAAHISQMPLGCSHSSDMFSWGQDSQRGFRVKDDDDTAAGSVHVFFHPGYVIRELVASRGARAFVSGDRDAFTVCGEESEAAGRTGKVKPSWVFYPPFSLSRIMTVRLVTEHDKNNAACFTERVKSSEKIRAVSCGDETVVLLSEGGKLLCVDTNQTPLVPRSDQTGLLWLSLDIHCYIQKWIQCIIVISSQSSKQQLLRVLCKCCFKDYNYNLRKQIRKTRFSGRRLLLVCLIKNELQSQCLWCFLLFQDTRGFCQQKGCSGCLWEPTCGGPH